MLEPEMREQKEEPDSLYVMGNQYIHIYILICKKARLNLRICRLGQTDLNCGPG